MKSATQVEEGVTNISIVHVLNVNLDSNACFTPLEGSNRTPDRLQLRSKSVPPAVRLEWG